MFPSRMAFLNLRSVPRCHMLQWRTSVRVIFESLIPGICWRGVAGNAAQRPATSGGLQTKQMYRWDSNRFPALGTAWPMCKYEVSELSNHKSLHSQKAPYIPVCLKALESRLQDQEREAAWNLGLRDLRCKKMQILEVHGCPTILGLALRVLSGFCSNMFQQFEDQNPKYHKLIQSASSWMQNQTWPLLEVVVDLVMSCALWHKANKQLDQCASQISKTVGMKQLKRCTRCTHVLDWSWYWNSQYRSQDLYGLTIFVIVLSDEVRRCLQQKSWSRLQTSYRSKQKRKPQA